MTKQLEKVTIALEKMQNVKKEMRRNIAKILKNCSVQEIETQSLQLSRKVLQFPLFQHAKAISIYLEMAQEASTKHIIQAAFEQGKHVYVPKIVGKGAEDLKMLRAYSLQDIQTFPKDKWSIPNPTLVLEDGQPRADAMETLELDLILLPGVAFDRQGRRLGHGKGYYDSFQRRLQERFDAEGKRFPTTIGLSLTPQLVENVPVDLHDRNLDYIATPHELIKKPEA